MQRSLDLLALTKRLEMIAKKPAVGRHFFRRFEFKGVKRRRSQAFYTGTSCLRTFVRIVYAQFMSQRHATSCTSARAKEEIYSHKGMVSVALTLLRVNSLGWSVTPTCFWIDDFLY